MASLPPPPEPLDELFATHGAAIDALASALGAEQQLPPYADKLWLLRYVLSFSDTPARATAARTCIAWRAANSALLAAAAARTPLPQAERILPHVVAGVHGASIHGEPLFIVRAGLSSPAAVMGAVSHAEVVSFLLYYKEQLWIACDAASRSRGRLVKHVALLHMEGASMSRADNRFIAAQLEVAKLSMTLFPQHLLRYVMCAPPAFFHSVFALLKPLMPATMLAKQAVCPGRARGAGGGAGGPAPLPAASCPFASTRFAPAALPSFLGGACRCTAAGGCVGGRPNAETQPSPAGGPRDAVLVVPARTVHDVTLAARGPRARLRYAFELADKGLEVSAWVAPHDDAGGGHALLPQRVLLPPTLHKADGGAVRGLVGVPVAGTVTLRFSNAHSLLTAKRVTVTAAVEEEEEGGAQEGEAVAAAACGAAGVALVVLDEEPGSGNGPEPTAVSSEPQSSGTAAGGSTSPEGCAIAAAANEAAVEAVAVAEAGRACDDSH